MKYTLTLSEKHLVELKSLILKEDGFERPAILLCGRSLISNDIWDGGPECRFLSKEIIPIPETDIKTNSKVAVNWNTSAFRLAMKKAAQGDLAICLVHSHPEGANSFSGIDDENEADLFKTIYNRNTDDSPHLSLVITYDGTLFARACTKRLKYHPISMIRTIGDRFSFHYSDKYANFNREEFNRQQLAFGKTLNNDLSKLRIGIIGCGATGSASAHLLARLGVGQLLLIDNDLVERSNLSRLYGATSADADAGRPKVEVLHNFITNIGIGCRVRLINDWVGSEKSRNALKSCDIILGCTDDNSGRVFLNRFAHFYLTPVIDMGIVIEPSKTEPNQIQALQGRVTVIIPGSTCLLCRNAIDRQLAREENLKRSDPLGFERQKEEAYVVGSGNPSPAVITFTTEVASMAVNELINRIIGFKRTPAENHIIRFFDKREDRRPGAKSQEGCPICNNDAYWGKGDTEPFLDQTN
ncbi:MAG: ThiF family adenylyltransferase [Bacteroidia bacterium]|nr:ThiF family adenylyltransferase [Bacteroidia bacterium]MBP7260000.1 ThiF family adenylyltransferase [Bacteroidia bacterium]MBP9179707.1 ThiF family adenylyltransferase [Bacteroidia bacterium]MBP9723894.1 ThiF family adenylyltransferase [Bacteroidia bacterium]